MYLKNWRATRRQSRRLTALLYFIHMDCRLLKHRRQGSGRCVPCGNWVYLYNYLFCWAIYVFFLSSSLIIMCILLLLVTLGFFSPELPCSTPFKLTVTVKNPLSSTCLGSRAAEPSYSMPLRRALHDRCPGVSKWGFLQKCRMFSPGWPHAHQTWCFSGSELAGCYGENINLTLLHSQGKPAEWRLKSNYPASREDQTGFDRPKWGRRLGVHSQDKQTWIHTPLLLQPEDPDALRVWTAFFLTFFSL